MRDQAPGGLAALLADVDVSLRPLVQAVAAAGRTLPSPGFELVGGDGAIAGTAELAWERAKIAVLMDHEVEYLERFVGQGWTVYVSGRDGRVARQPDCQPAWRRPMTVALSKDFLLAFSNVQKSHQKRCKDLSRALPGSHPESDGINYEPIQSARKTRTSLRCRSTRPTGR